MSNTENIEEGVQILQELGLLEYEARCFIGLTRLDVGTAKILSELTEVPRTRVYEAIRLLESKGLVEVQHSSPKRFRAVSLSEAIGTLRDQYDSRMQRLQRTLESLDRADAGAEDATIQQVWALSGSDAIENRTEKLIESATNEIVLILCDESMLTDSLIATLNNVAIGVDLRIGALTEYLHDHIQEVVPAEATIISTMGWLTVGQPHEDDTVIGRLLLVDNSAILVSTLKPDTSEEQAIFGKGIENGLVVLGRRVMTQGLLERRTPQT